MFLEILDLKNFSIYIVTLVMSIQKLIGQLPSLFLTMKKILLKLPFSPPTENLTRLNFSLKNFRPSNMLNSDVRTYILVGIALPVKTRVKPLIISGFAVTTVLLLIQLSSIERKNLSLSFTNMDFLLILQHVI